MTSARERHGAEVTDTYVECQLCHDSVQVSGWPTHRDAHTAYAKAHPEDPVRFCHDPSTVNEAILCRREKGHRGQHAGPLGELKWV